MSELFDTNLSYSALELFLKFYYFHSFHMLIGDLVLLCEVKQLLYTRVNMYQQGAVVSVHITHKQPYSIGQRDETVDK